MNDAPIQLGGPCIFCGGNAVAVTVDHCPPKGMFRDKVWPVGYAFPSCNGCNGGISDDDLMIAFMAQINPESTNEQRLQGLMYMLQRQRPGALPSMELSAIEARAAARRLGLRPVLGQTYQKIGIVRVPLEMEAAVSTLAAKLSKAVYFKQTGKVFPADGGIMMTWFTNAQRIQNGGVTALDALSSLESLSTPKTRNGRDLQDQFDYRYSQGEGGELNVLRAVFGPVFGFATIFSPTPGTIEGLEDRMKERTSTDKSPFLWVNGARKQLL